MKNFIEELPDGYVNRRSQNFILEGPKFFADSGPSD